MMLPRGFKMLSFAWEFIRHILLKSMQLLIYNDFWGARMIGKFFLVGYPLVNFILWDYYCFYSTDLECTLLQEHSVVIIIHPRMSSSPVLISKYFCNPSRSCKDAGEKFWELRRKPIQQLSSNHIFEGGWQGKWLRKRSSVWFWFKWVHVKVHDHAFLAIDWGTFLDLRYKFVLVYVELLVSNTLRILGNFVFLDSFLLSYFFNVAVILERLPCTEGCKRAFTRLAFQNAKICFKYWW